MKRMLSLAVLTGLLAIGTCAAWADGPFPTAMTDGTFGPAGSVTPNSGTSGTEIYNAINQLLGTSYTNNAEVDYLEYTGNASTWVAQPNSAYAIIGLDSYNTNALEVYNTLTPGTLTNPLVSATFTGNPNLGNGSFTKPYPGAGSYFAPGVNFGFAINTVGETQLGAHTITTPPGGTNWYSDPTLNSDGMDHMLVYNLSSLNGTTIYVTDPGSSTPVLVTLEDPYLLSFEDLPLNDNGAYSDLDYSDLNVLVSGMAPVPEPITSALFGLGLFAMAVFSQRRKLAFIS